MMPYRIQQLGKRISKQASVARGMLHVDMHDLSGSILLAGSGRSGTTWMSQIINHGNPYRDIFEPFHPQHVRQAKKWPAMRYVSVESSDDKLAQQIKGLLAGRVRSRWTDAYNRKHVTNQRLIKAIRTNLMLGWIRNQYPQVKLLFAMRHPCAVAYSRVKLKWDTHLDELLSQSALIYDHLAPYREMIEQAERNDNVWRKHLAMWCIENIVPLRELTPSDAHLMRYEDLCQNFDAEVAALFAYLGREVPTGIRNAARQRSASFRRDSAILRGGDLISDWQRHVEVEQIDAMLDMLAAFGLSHLYDENPSPRCPSDAAFIDTTMRQQPISLHKDAA
jgi:hypothetical protein